MSFRVEIEITPDADGVHCGECRLCLDHRSPWHQQPTIDKWMRHWVRCPACLAAEKAWKERNP